jgi:hypothetical protein
MVTRWLAPALVLAGCASVPAPEGPEIEMVAGKPGTVRLLLSKEESLRLSRAGIMDSSSASGLTDRARYRVAVEAYVADVLAAKGLCPRGFGGLDIAPAAQPFDAAITVSCLAP